MIYAGILAAGIGVRMHRQDLPKPFLTLGEKPIIMHTLEQFFVNPRIGAIIVVVPEIWRVYAENVISKYDCIGKTTNVIAGGVNKTESVKLIVEYIQNSTGIMDDDILVLHDAIRPFITQRIIDENIDTARQFGAANTVMTTNDTIIVSDDGVTLTEIPAKNRMLAEQTPQTIQLRLLSNTFVDAAKQSAPLERESELARLFLRQGISVRLVRGEYSNMKIINPYDLEIANALLKERKK